MPRVRNQSFITIEDFNDYVDQVAELEIRIRAAEAERDDALNKITFSANQSINQLKEEQQSLLGKADVFARKHRRSLIPAKRKSASTASAVYGFRQSSKMRQIMPTSEAVEYLDKINQADCYELRPSIKKSLIKSRLEEVQELKNVVRVETTETFYVEPKVERQEPKE